MVVLVTERGQDAIKGLVEDTAVIHNTDATQMPNGLLGTFDW